MAVRTTGAEWKRFYNDKDFWPDGWFHEEEQFEVNGQVISEDDHSFDPSAIADDAQVKILGGVVYKGDYRTDEPVNLITHFNRWRKLQTHTSFSVECPKDKLEAVKEAVKAAGGKVLA